MLLAGFAVAASSLGLASSPVQAADPPCAGGKGPTVVVNVVKTVGGDEQVLYCETVTAAQIEQWSDFDDDVQYSKRRNAAGDVSAGPLVTKGRGISLQALLGEVNRLNQAKADAVKGFRFSETLNRGIPSVLSEPELADPSSKDYPFGDDVPAIYLAEKKTKIGYVRPLRATGKDVNYADIFKKSGTTVLTFHTTGALIQPTVTASSSSVTTKDKPTFTVDAGNTLVDSVTWHFGDGESKEVSATKRSHKYKRKGTFPVFAEVRGDNGTYGRSEPIEIKVNNPPKAPSSGTGGGTGTGGSGGVTGGGSGYVPPYDPGTVDPPSDSSVEDVPEDQPTEQVPVDDGLEEVEGYVLAGSEIVPGGVPEAIPGTQDSNAPAPATQESLRKRLATWVVVAIAIALLVGAGAASETRWFRHRLRHLRRSA